MPYLAGIVLALTISMVTSVLGFDRDRAFYPTVLVVVASYYVLFAVMGSSREALVVEIPVMAGCMLEEGPAPSVETPLHSLLPHRVIAHTHDVATMSLTNIRDAEAERLVGELFEGRIVYVPYVRPGFPLARAVGRSDRYRPKRSVLRSPTTGWWSGVTAPRSVTRD